MAEEEAARLAASAPDAAALDGLVKRREAGEPLAWIVGWVDFAGVRVEVGPGVFVPRPHTVALAERAAELLPRGGRIVDLCAGAGAIAALVGSRRPDARVVAVDLDGVSIRCARENGLPVVQADVRQPALAPGSCDVVSAVAPYVPTGELAFLARDSRQHEPRVALDGGADGLDVVRAVVDAARVLLRPGGWLLAEIGGDQDAYLAPVLTGFVDVQWLRDEEDDLRGVRARRA